MRILPFILSLLFLVCCRKENTVKEISKQAPFCYTDQEQLRLNLDKLGNLRPDRNDPYPPPRGNYSCIYIDFDGETVVNPYWNKGEPFYCEPSGLTIDQQKDVLARVRNYFYPFRVYVTDTLSYYQEANRNKKMRVIVTPTSNWQPVVGGISLYDSFIWGNETPAFVFSDRLLFSPHFVADLVSHESGHTLNLAHQSLWSELCSLSEPLTPGVIMGNSLSVSQGEWTYGPTSYGCTIYQDDSLMIKNKLGLRL
ncbi:MAG TPA: hypothetical protein VK498_06330 [Ferruginibacter sp.]|nr:hypothetical protein [Ferruginibacter sp.]